MARETKEATKELDPAAPEKEISKYINVKFQDGKKEIVGTNGCELIEAVEFVTRRLKSESLGKNGSDEKKLAYRKMQEALFWLGAEK